MHIFSQKSRGRCFSEFEVSLLCLQRAFQVSQSYGVRPCLRKGKPFCIHFLVLSYILSGEGTGGRGLNNGVLAVGLTNLNVNGGKPVLSPCLAGVGWGWLQNIVIKMSFGLELFVFPLVLDFQPRPFTCYASSIVTTSTTYQIFSKEWRSLLHINLKSRNCSEFSHLACYEKSGKINHFSPVNQFK